MKHEINTAIPTREGENSNKTYHKKQKTTRLPHIF